MQLLRQVRADKLLSRSRTFIKSTIDRRQSSFSFFRAANLVSTASTSTFDACRRGRRRHRSGRRAEGLEGTDALKAPTLPAWTWTGLYLGVNAG
jgi:hypothetical protein